MQLTPQDVLERDAAAWAVAMDRGLTPDEQAGLATWLGQDPRRQGALVRARAVWRAAAQPTSVRTRPFHLATRRALVGGLAAAGLVAAVGVGLQLWPEGAVTTPRGEVRRLSMADGSEAVMNADTRMAMRFSSDQRRIELRDGEAWFDVAKDPARPFVVMTSAAQVIAIGTAFSVREIGDATEVVVTEGTVRIVPKTGDAPVLVTAGETIRIDPARSSQKTVLDPARVHRRLAWREGLIMLDGETLGEAAAEFNRYNVRQIRVSAEAAQERVVGVFRIHDEGGFARANAELLDLNITSSSDEIYLNSRRSVIENSQ